MKFGSKSKVNMKVTKLIRRCKYCRKHFETFNSKQRFCSKECQLNYKRKHSIKHPINVQTAPKPWFVIKHNEKIRKHCMELIEKENP